MREFLLGALVVWLFAGLVVMSQLSRLMGQVSALTWVLAAPAWPLLMVGFVSHATVEWVDGEGSDGGPAA